MCVCGYVRACVLWWGYVCCSPTGTGAWLNSDKADATLIVLGDAKRRKPAAALARFDRCVVGYPSAGTARAGPPLATLTERPADARFSSLWMSRFDCRCASSPVDTRPNDSWWGARGVALAVLLVAVILDNIDGRRIVAIMAAAVAACASSRKATASAAAPKPPACR